MGSEGSCIKNKIQSGRDFLDRLALKLPGFSGYVEYTERYNSDRTLRMFMADKLLSFKEEVNSCIRSHACTNDLSILPEIDSISVNLERSAKRCQAADFGANSSFTKNTVKFTPADQDKILERDSTLVARLDDIESLIKSLSAQADIPSVTAQVRQKLKEFDETFENRTSIIMEA